MTNELKAMVDEYIKLDAQEKELSSKKDSLSKSIKALMTADSLTKITNENGTSVELRESVKPSYDEEKLIEYLKSNNKRYLITEAVQYKVLKAELDASIISTEELNRLGLRKENITKSLYVIKSK